MLKSSANESLLNTALILALASVFTCYLIANLTLQEGFSQIEFSMMALMPGVVFFFCTFIGGIYGLMLYRKHCFKEEKQPSTWLALGILLLGLLVVTGLLDALYFFVIDKSLSQEFANGFQLYMGMEQEELEGFAELPFLMQNGAVSIGAIVMALLLATPIANSLAKKPEEKNPAMM
ncbi:hypothetical protein AAG747_00150 [Rapidithrix thailandica]|uniref:DUF4199 domain-containing protein n=1 Tax=Rapidithrix thailandica TaxID=413964 RepID=A0AAW9S056_9BACT